ncbi:HdeD family acid-resistance protein [Altericroceibacterium endophyticum]|uniref:HdeD family acid-resistance protein n=1 Tax=Altericroceibacterium endophyticum TaxID=1808508 RepID=A0A6I4T8K1_9SPHN|nr:DUF308 domain-containing protein [Altericroceibacterium endophyticum]MXO66075.1 HdeD family acid-resistance protein [Altericroceibacterium endophyticum]
MTDNDHQDRPDLLFLRGIGGHNWGWFALRGALGILLGIAALAAPGFTLFVFALIFAAFAFVDGVAMLVAGARRPHTESGRWWALILSGIAGVAIGTLFLIFPLASTYAYAALTVMLIVAWALVTGAFQIIAGIKLRHEIEGEWLMILSGAIGLLFGLALWWLAIASPDVTILSVAWLIAFYAFASGTALLVLAFRLRRARN